MLAISVWLLGALFCVGITLNITWRLEDRGIAINEAGSLRKQSYLMLAMVQAQQTQTLPQEISVFEKKLANLADLKKRPLILGTQNLQPLQAVQNGFIEILSLQFPGKKRMKTFELLNGITFSENAIVA